MSGRRHLHDCEFAARPCQLDQLVLRLFCTRDLHLQRTAQPVPRCPTFLGFLRCTFFFLNLGRKRSHDSCASAGSLACSRGKQERHVRSGQDGGCCP